MKALKYDLYELRHGHFLDPGKNYNKRKSKLDHQKIFELIGFIFTLCILFKKRIYKNYFDYLIFLSYKFSI